MSRRGGARRLSRGRSRGRSPRIRRGLQECLYLGNLDARRDWGFAGDYVEAMWLMMQAERTGRLRDRDRRDAFGARVLRAGVSLATCRSSGTAKGVEEVGVDAPGQTRVRIDPRYFRPAEVDLLQGDASYAQRKLGWKPTVDFQQLVRMMVEADMKNVDRVPR